MSQPPPRATLTSLSPELLEGILEASLDRTHSLNLRQLLHLQLVSKCFASPARRLIFRQVLIRTANSGRSFLRILTGDATLGRHVRSLEVLASAYDGAQFNDLLVDEVIRRCPLLVRLDLPFGPFAPLGDGRSPMASFPPTLKHFRVSMSSHESEIDSEDDESNDSDGSGGGGGGGGAVPAILGRLADLPDSVESLTFEQIHSAAFLKDSTPTTPFPLTHLHDVEFVRLAPPSVANRSLRRLKLWGHDANIQNPDVTAVIQAVGADLEEFLWRPLHPDRGLMLTSLLPCVVSVFPLPHPKMLIHFLSHLTSLRKLTVGPGGAGPTMYTSLSTPHLTHLCIALSPIAANLDLFIPHLHPTGSLCHLRRLEVYSQIYFPPPIELEFLDETPNPPTQLRELRLSHITVPRAQIDALLAVVGAGLRALSIHHVTAPAASIIKTVPNLLRLEIGVDGAPDARKSILKAIKAPNLHLLRFHFNSRIELTELVEKIEQGKLDTLRTIDVTGIFPDQVTEEWTGALVRRISAQDPPYGSTHFGVRTGGNRALFEWKSGGKYDRRMVERGAGACV
ncbi:hypothetical protein P7C70_g6811, partial [Phenoliferia sp. Uapishka_3]